MGLSLLTLSLSAHAGIKAEQVTLTLAGGEEFFATKRNLQNTGVNIFAISYQFTQNWGIQGAFGLFTTKYKPSENFDKQVNGRLYFIDGTYHFMPEKTFSPYVLAGVGVSDINSSQFDATYQANVNAGIGVQYFPDEIVSFHIEARDLYTISGGKNDVIVAGGVNIALNFC